MDKYPQLSLGSEVDANAFMYELIAVMHTVAYDGLMRVSQMRDNALSSDVRIRVYLSDPARTISVEGDVEGLLGFTSEAFLSGRAALASLVHHGDQDIADTLLTNPLSVPDTLQGTFNIRLRHADGRIRCVRGEYVKSVSAEGVTAVDVLLQDAKRLWHRQGDQTMMANFKAMMDNTDDFIFFKDRNHVFTGASQTLVVLTPPIEQWTELIGKTDYDVFPEAYADVYYELEKMVFSGVPVAHEVQEILRKDGSKGWVDNRKYPIRDDAGAIIGLFGIARDISDLKSITQELEEQQQFSRSLIEHLPGIFYLYAYPENRLVLWNKRHEELLGFSSDEMKNRHILDWHLPENHEATLAAVESVMTTGFGLIDAPLLAKDGTPIYFSLNGVRFDTQGKSYLMGVGTDITEQRKTEEALRVSVEWHRLLTDSVSDVIWTMDLTGRLTYVSPSVEKLRGYTVEEVMQQSMEDYLTPESLPVARAELGRFIALICDGKRPADARCELEQRCKDGSTVWTEITASVMFDSSGKLVSILGVSRDITERRQMEEQVRQMAFHDPLTGLPNRRLLYDRLSQALATSRRSGLFGGLLFIDLDNFKPLNDTYGHEVGDLLLIEVARRLNSCVREMDTVARYGGDEFVVIIGELEADRDESTEHASYVAEKIRSALAEPYLFPLARAQGGEGETEAMLEYHCTASVGLTVFAGDHASREDILKWADAAMYQAKVKGNNSVQIWTTMSTASPADCSLASTFIHLVWHSAYECGDPVIDEQHRALFADANRILSAMLAERPVNELADLIDHLIGSVVRHFKDEEAIIATAGFKGTAEHRAVHNQLLDRALTLVGRFHAGILGVGELFQFLGYELVAQHMLSADREFFAVLRTHDRSHATAHDLDQMT